MSDVRKRKKHSKSSKTRSSIECVSTPDANISSDLHLSDVKVKQMTTKQQLWLFAFPQSFDIALLSNQELDIPDLSAPNTVVAYFNLDNSDYEVFESEDANNIVNLVAKTTDNTFVAGRPFQRSFIVRKAIKIPTIEKNAIQKRQNVVQVVKAAQKQCDEIAQTDIRRDNFSTRAKKRKPEKEVQFDTLISAKKHKIDAPKNKDKRDGKSKQTDDSSRVKKDKQTSKDKSKRKDSQKSRKHQPKASV